MILCYFVTARLPEPGLCTTEYGWSCVTLLQQDCLSLDYVQQSMDDLVLLCYSKTAWAWTMYNRVWMILCYFVTARLPEPGLCTTEYEWSCVTLLQQDCLSLDYVQQSMDDLVLLCYSKTAWAWTTYNRVWMILCYFVTARLPEPGLCTTEYGWSCVTLLQQDCLSLDYVQQSMDDLVLLCYSKTAWAWTMYNRVWMILCYFVTARLPEPGLCTTEYGWSCVTLLQQDCLSLDYVQQSMDDLVLLCYSKTAWAWTMCNRVWMILCYFVTARLPEPGLRTTEYGWWFEAAWEFLWWSRIIWCCRATSSQHDKPHDDLSCKQRIPRYKHGQIAQCKLTCRNVYVNLYLLSWLITWVC